MSCRVVAGVLGLAFLFSPLQVNPLQAPLRAQDPDLIHVGLVDSLVKDLSPGKQKLLDDEFQTLVQEFTGFKSKVFQGGDPYTAGKKLANGEWHLAVFQGVEFAWAKAKDDKLEALMIAGSIPPTVHAVLVAKKDSKITGFADLKGKDVHLIQLKEHARLFAEKGVQGNPSGFFKSVNSVSSAEGALDDVLIGKVQAALVDNVILEQYKKIHPGRHARLAVVAQSESFPAPAIAYRTGALSEKVLKNFREGMLKANNSDKGREMMANFKITSFENVPPTYAQELATVMKNYPAPK